MAIYPENMNTTEVKFTRKSEKKWKEEMKFGWTVSGGLVWWWFCNLEESQNSLV